MKFYFIALVISTLSLLASPLIQGGEIGDITLKDQFGISHQLKQSSQKIIIVFDREQSGKLNEYLAKQPKEYLELKKTLLIADISQMPTFISESFALPKMQQYGYNVLLIRDEELSLRFPYMENKITIMETVEGKITKIEFASSREEAIGYIEKW